MNISRRRFAALRYVSEGLRQRFPGSGGLQRADVWAPLSSDLPSLLEATPCHINATRSLSDSYSCLLKVGHLRGWREQRMRKE